MEGEIKGNTIKKAPTHELAKLRGQQAAMYKLKGFTYEEVLRKINEESVEKRWGSIGMAQLRKDVARYANYTAGYNAGEMRDVQEGEKLMYIAELERNYNLTYTMIIQAVQYYQDEEKMKLKGAAKPIINKSSLSYFMELLIKTGEHLAKLKGWEKSSVNILNINNQNNEFEIHTRANEKLGELDERTAEGVKALLDSLHWEDEESNRLADVQGSDSKQIAEGK